MDIVEQLRRRTVMDWDAGHQREIPDADCQAAAEEIIKLRAEVKTLQYILTQQTKPNIYYQPRKRYSLFGGD